MAAYKPIVESGGGLKKLGGGDTLDTTVNNVVVEAHAARHQPGGADAIPTAAPAATGVSTASAVGTATSLARSDHSHQSNTAPAAVTKAAAVIGTSGEPARADHKHDITTAAAVAVGTANAEGAAASLARSDHTHQVTGLAIASQAQGDVLYFNGTNWVRLAPGTSGQLLQTSGAAANPSWANAPIPVTSVAEASGDITTTSTSDVLATSMTLTPAAGTYQVWFTTSVDNGSNNTRVFASIYAGGVQTAASERQFARATQAITGVLATSAKVTVNGSQAIEALWRVSAGTGTMHQRTLVIMKVT